MIEISYPSVFVEEPRVSVVMLAFNHEDFLATAIEGVLAQRCDFAIELIIAEDCSTDGTRVIAERYMKEHPSIIRIITGETNVGVMRNFYRALEGCRGHYIAFCEGDDYWCNVAKLTKQVGILDSDESVGMVHGNFVNAYSCGDRWKVNSVGVHDQRTPHELRGNIFGVMVAELVSRTCTVCYRKSVLDAFQKSPLATPSFLAGDLPMAVFCSASWRIDYVDEVVAVYRLSPSSATRGSFSAKVRFLKSVIEIHQEIEKMYGLRPDYNASGYSWACHTLGRAAFRAQDHQALLLAQETLTRVDPQGADAMDLRILRLLVRMSPLDKLVNGAINLFRKFQITIKKPGDSLVL